jgi:hypothetical protein
MSYDRVRQAARELRAAAQTLIEWPEVHANVGEMWGVFLRADAACRELEAAMDALPANSAFQVIIDEHRDRLAKTDE